MPIAQAGTPTSVKTAATVQTPAMNSTGADLLVCSIIAADGANFVSAADSFVNTWVQPGTLVRNTPAAQRAGMPYVLAPTVGASHTFTTVQQFFQNSIIAAAFSGVASRQLESSASSIPSGTSHTVASGALTPSEDGALILSMFAPPHNVDAGAITPPPGMALLNSVAIGTNAYQLYVAFEIQTTATPRTPTWTTTNAVSSCGITAIFLPSAGGGGGGGNVPIQLIEPRSMIFLSRASGRR